MSAAGGLDGARYVIVNTYPRSGDAAPIQADTWERHVPDIARIPGFVAVAYLETVDGGEEGASLTCFATPEGAQAYLDSDTRRATDAEGRAFRPGADRRLMRVIRATWNIDP